MVKKDTFSLSKDFIGDGFSRKKSKRIENSDGGAKDQLAREIAGFQRLYDKGHFVQGDWGKDIVVREEKGIPLFDEVIAGLSVPKSSLFMYNKNKRGDFALRQTQRNLLQAEKFTLTDNFVKTAVSLCFSYPRYIAQLMPKAIPCFDNLWIEWNELARFDALQEEFKKLDIPADSNRKSVANRLGYHVQRSSKGFTYNFFTCDAQYREDGTKGSKKLGLPFFEWTFLNDEKSLTNVESPHWPFALGTAYSKFFENDEGMARLNSFSKNFTFRPSFIAPALYKEFCDMDNFIKNDSSRYESLLALGGHGIDGDIRFLTAVFALLNYPRYVRAMLPAPKKINAIRWGRRVPKNEIKVVEIELPKRGVNVHSQLFTGHGTPKRQHARRGHPRRYKDRSGRIIKEIWIEPKVVGNPELGIINHEYVLQIQKDTKQKKGEK